MSPTRLDYIPGDSFLHRTHVVVKIAIMLSILVSMFATGNIWVLLVLLGVTVFLYRISDVPWSYFRGLAVLIPALLLFMMVAQALWYSGNRTPLFEPIYLPFRINFSSDGLEANALTLYREGLLFGAVLAIRMLGMFLTFPLIFLTTPTSRLIAGLTEVGLPYQIAFVFTMALRFIPTLLTSRERIMDAQRLRGIDVSGRGLIRTIRTTVPTIVPMITTSLRMTHDLEIAIESRAFGAYPKRTNYHGEPFTARHRNQVVALLLATFLFALLVRIFWPGRGL